LISNKTGPPKGDKYAERGSYQCQQQTLGKQLANDARSIRAHSHAHRIVHLVDGTFELFRAHFSKRPPHAGPLTAVCVLAAPEGITLLDESGLVDTVVTAAIDERLNEQAYIVPGLGDAGDRLFGTK